LQARLKASIDQAKKTKEKPTRGDAGNTTPAPVSDGQFVYAAFGSSIVACYDLNGTRQWIQNYNVNSGTEYGRAASPVLAGGKLLLSMGALSAVDPKTGKELWKKEDVSECPGTPVAAKTAELTSL
jgi:outer membrane protein assembly factor BamB